MPNEKMDRLTIAMNISDILDDIKQERAELDQGTNPVSLDDVQDKENDLNFLCGCGHIVNIYIDNVCPFCGR